MSFYHGFCRPTAITIALTLLSACANQTSSTRPNKSPEPLPSYEIEANQHFQQDSLYRLLTAELALVRERYDVGLDNYVDEAISGRDVNVTARATQIARILKKHDETLLLAEQWRELNPSSYEARFVLISEYIYAERFDDAFTEAKRLLATGHSAGFEDIAIDAAQKNFQGQARLSDQYAELLADYPNTSELLIGHSILQQAQGQLEPALKSIRKANKLDNRNARGLFQEFRVLSALQRNDEAIDAYGAMVDLQPNNIQLRSRYAHLLISYDLARALEQYDILHKQDPQDSDILLNLALLQFDQGHVDQAKISFENLIKRQQHESTAYYSLGEIAEQENDNISALNYYLQVKDGNHYVDASSHAAELIAQQESFASALVFLSARKEQAPRAEDKESLYLIEAETLNANDKSAHAASVYKLALAEFPGSVKLHFSRAMFYTERRETDKAEQDFLVVLAQVPNNAATLNALGYTLLDQTDRITDAEVYIRRAYKLQPNDAAIIDSMGWLYFKQGQITEAIELLQHAFDQSPDHEIAAHLGEALWTEGKQRRARKVWQQGLKHRPQSATILSTLERLGVEL